MVERYHYSNIRLSHPKHLRLFHFGLGDYEVRSLCDRLLFRSTVYQLMKRTFADVNINEAVGKRISKASKIFTFHRERLIMFINITKGAETAQYACCKIWTGMDLYTLVCKTWAGFVKHGRFKHGFR